MSRDPRALLRVLNVDAFGAGATLTAISAHDVAVRHPAADTLLRVLRGRPRVPGAAPAGTEDQSAGSAFSPAGPAPGACGRGGDPRGAAGQALASGYVRRLQPQPQHGREEAEAGPGRLGRDPPLRREPSAPGLQVRRHVGRARARGATA